ncbi:hypothetical protein [Herbaspirillum sp. SJZ099]|uniref:hypothetical protein n=1 Tax=Herbaspirillum sp. SJZ099 TaxID=2572916 RepID=UPI0011A43CF9|nr:hypothetical protein [Herbaspirillum sp. SJZ099]
MFDGFWYGIFGGLFGSAIAQWMSRFKYFSIFFVTVLGSQFVFFVMAVFYRGWGGAFDILIQDQSTSLIIFLYVPLGFGGLGILVAFLGSLSSSKKLGNEKIDKTL